MLEPARLLKSGVPHLQAFSDLFYRMQEHLDAQLDRRRMGAELALIAEVARGCLQPDPLAEV